MTLAAPVALGGEGPVGAPGPGAGVLLLGIGNPLRSDDGVGPVVAEQLALDPRLAGADVRALHQLAPELVPDLCAAGLVVVVDATVGCESAGAIAVRWIGQAGCGSAAEAGAAGGATGAPMSHHLDADALAAMAVTLWGPVPPIAVIGIGVASLAVGEGLTPPVAAAVPLVVERVVQLVEARRDA